MSNVESPFIKQLEMGIPSARMKLKQAGRTLIDYDSEKKTAPESKNASIAAIEKPVQNVVGAKFNFTSMPAIVSRGLTAQTN